MAINRFLSVVVVGNVMFVTTRAGVPEPAVLGLVVL
jgi:hypothetical protein